MVWRRVAEMGEDGKWVLPIKHFAGIASSVQTNSSAGEYLI